MVIFHSYVKLPEGNDGGFIMGFCGILEDFFLSLSDFYRIEWGFVVKIVELFNVVYSHLWESNWDCDNGNI